MKQRVLLFLIVAVLAGSVGCIHIYEPQSAAKGGGPGGPGGPAKQKPEFKPWADATKDTTKLEGFFTWHQTKDNKLLLELPADRLGKEFGMVLHLSQGAGVFNLNDGLSLSDTMLMEFTRVGNTVYLVQMNPRFVASGDAGMQEAVADNRGNSIIAAFDVVSVNDDTKNVLVDTTDFFVSDYPDMAQWLKPYYGGKPVMFDRQRSYVEKLQGFPKNDELDVMFTYKAGEYPVFGGEGIPDYRSIPFGVRYSMFALPEHPMMPRLADDRVGHFIDAVKDFSRDQQPEWYRRYINRWRLEKRNPGEALSEPVKPIVYYVDWSVPEPYRQYVKDAIEAWNKAFEAAGFKNAVVAKDPPKDDPTWSAEDIRYSSIKWSAAHQMGYAIGPSESDPRTGEILNADILISSSFVRGWLSDYQDFAGAESGSAHMLDAMEGNDPLWQNLPSSARDRLCVEEMGAAHQLGVQYAMMQGLGLLKPDQPLPPEFLRAAIMDLILHETGHTLGLRHNFKASSGIPMDHLHDESYTEQHGVAVSVMDYNPVNVSPDPKRQGDYWTTAPGDYDVWAITYAYKPIYKPGTTEPMDSPDDELPELKKIASRSAEPLLTYNTDEDNWLGPYAVDPYTNAWDLSSDPVAYAKERAEIVHEVLPKLEDRVIADGTGYNRLRNAVGNLMFEAVYPFYNATKMVGGIRFARDHKGDPHERLPFTPLPAQKQRDAVQAIVSGVFSENSFHFDPELLNKLAPNRYSHWGMGINLPVEYPTHDIVDGWQRNILGSLLSPPRLRRMVESEIRYADGAKPYTIGEMFDTLSGSVWSELGPAGGSAKSVDSFRRNLQRDWEDQFIDVMMGVTGPGLGPVPDDARALARYQLTAVAGRIGAVMNGSGLDEVTRAHLAESKARIDKALDASLSMSVEGANP
ncbi:MAG TPA: zinc-dependent metalloprotease [Candidatus Saccharimonadales bacterium]|nr:zinc-dependent metalloprotease [Candidatus Saccharimonadales bacterium]